MENIYWRCPVPKIKRFPGNYSGFSGSLLTEKNKIYLDWAKLISTIVWDSSRLVESFTNNDFKTRGWISVSVQNHHLDVFGVVIAPSVYRLGTYINNPRYKDLALVIYRTCNWKL